MPITVPISSPSPAPPMIDGDHIPNDEREAVRHLYGILFLLGWYEQQFRHALALFDGCVQGRSPPPETPNLLPKYPIIEAEWNTLNAWETMAARDGAMSIYHFGQALIAIAPWLRNCPTPRACVDHAVIRLARKSFFAALPSYNAIRHAVGHAADFNATIELLEEHSVQAPWGHAGFHIEGKRAVRLTEQLIGRTYYVSYAGDVHHFEMADNTLAVLLKVRERVYAAFDQAADPEFYQCPYCGRRDLQEVYGRRIYKCAGCNDRLITDEEFMYARTRRLRRARRVALLALIAWRARGAT
jgi:hypothetical protein